MTYPEFLRWAAYRNKRGSLHPGMRMEHGAAMVSCILANLHRKKESPPHKVSAFMPHADPEPVVDEDFEAFARNF